MDVSERNFEAAVEAALLRDPLAPAAEATGEASPMSEAANVGFSSGGFHRRTSEAYDRELCVIPQDVIGFISATQPKEWQKMLTQHGAEARPLLFKRLASLSQVLTFTDGDLEKLYVFAKLLWRSLPVNRDPLPVEVQQNIDLDAFRLRNTGTTKIQLKQGTEELDPMASKEPEGTKPEEIEPLSRIIHDLNERSGTDFTEQDKVFIQQLEHRLAGDPALEASIQVNPPEDARLTFNQIVNDRLQEMVDSNFKFYRQITDNADFAEELLTWMFERYRKAKKFRYRP